MINANATISEKNSCINSDGGSENESRAPSMTFPRNKPEVSLKGMKMKKYQQKCLWSN